MKLPFLALLCLLATSAYADSVYKYIDAEGHVTYTNVPTKGAQRVQLTPLSSYRSAPRKENNEASGVRVDSNTQKQRDNGRRKILEQELANEQRALADAQKALAEGQATRLGNEHNYVKYQERVKQLQDVVTSHEKNITALQQELGKAGANAQQ